MPPRQHNSATIHLSLGPSRKSFPRQAIPLQQRPTASRTPIPSEFTSDHSMTMTTNAFHT